MHSKLRFNCSEVEDRLQGLCHHYGLGRRLHRVVGAGGGGPVDPEEATNKDYLAKVFLTCLRVTEWQPPLGPGVAITGMRVGGEMPSLPVIWMATVEAPHTYYCIIY